MSPFGEEKVALLQDHKGDVEWNGPIKPERVSDPASLKEAESLRFQQRRCRRLKIHIVICFFLTIYWIVEAHYKNAKWVASLKESNPYWLPAISGVALDQCAHLKDERALGAIISSARFDLGAGEPLYFASRGSLPHGSLKVVQSEGNNTNVRTTVALHTDVRGEGGQCRELLLNLVRVCKVKKEDGSGATGIGIFSPRWQHATIHHFYRNTTFDVTIELPRLEGPLTIPSLETDMPMFSHTLETAEGAVVYQNLHIRTELAPVEAVDATARNLTVFTTDAPIKGNFRTSKSIALRTANAPIDVALELENLDSADATSATLENSKGAITARSSLIATNWAEDNTGNFILAASTTNANIGLIFPFAPINSSLSLDASTTAGNIDAALHPTYEGDFFLSTQRANARVISRRDEPDPENKGRQRGVATCQMRSDVSGETWWGQYDEEKDSRGDVKLKSDQGPILLRFSGSDA